MADAGKSTLQSILENLRDAAVGFGERFANPANIQSELTNLLADLGIDDPCPAARYRMRCATRPPLGPRSPTS